MSDSASIKAGQDAHSTEELVRRLLALAWQFRGDCLPSVLVVGTMAFELMAGCSENRFVGNEIANIAAGGFRVNGGTERNPVWERTRNNQITDNWLHHYGLDYPSAVGVLLMNTEGNTVAYNHIHSPFPACRPALRCPGRGRFQA